jgi:hypothetical protein
MRKAVYGVFHGHQRRLAVVIQALVHTDRDASILECAWFVVVEHSSVSLAACVRFCALAGTVCLRV